MKFDELGADVVAKGAHAENLRRTPITFAAAEAELRRVHALESRRALACLRLERRRQQHRPQRLAHKRHRPSHSVSIRTAWCRFARTIRHFDHGRRHRRTRRPPGARDSSPSKSQENTNPPDDPRCNLRR